MEINQSRELITILTEQDLKNLNCNADEIALVLEFQDLLPVLCQDGRIEKFCVDARSLYEQLKGRDLFANWIKANLKHFIENEDFIVYNSKTSVCFGLNQSKEKSVKSSNRGGSNRVDYLLTLDTAKEISMFAGALPRANEELQNRSRLVRKYFILMENIVRDKNVWDKLRAKTKKGYKPMDVALAEYIARNQHRVADHWDFKKEANIINLILFGYKAQDIRLIKGIFDKVDLRDCLTTEQQAYIDEAQKLNSTLLQADVEDSMRYKIIYKSFINNHPHPEMVSDDIDTINAHRKGIGVM